MRSSFNKDLSKIMASIVPNISAENTNVLAANDSKIKPKKTSFFKEVGLGILDALTGNVKFPDDKPTTEKSSEKTFFEKTLKESSTIVSPLSSKMDTIAKNIQTTNSILNTKFDSAEKYLAIIRDLLEDCCLKSNMQNYCNCDMDYDRKKPDRGTQGQRGRRGLRLPNVLPFALPFAAPALPSLLPESIPQITPEAAPVAPLTPELTPRTTPEVTPLPSPSLIPEITPKTTPETIPQITPEAAPYIQYKSPRRTNVIGREPTEREQRIIKIVQAVSLLGGLAAVGRAAAQIGMRGLGKIIPKKSPKAITPSLPSAANESRYLVPGAAAAASMMPLAAAADSKITQKEKNINQSIEAITNTAVSNFYAAKPGSGLPSLGTELDNISTQNNELMRSLQQNQSITPIVSNNVVSNNTQSIVPIKAQTRVESSFSDYMRRTAAY